MTALLLTAIACGSGPAAVAADEATWGNERETMTILHDGARFEGLCLAGVISEKVVIDQAGTFSARGTLRHVGGARRDDDGRQEVVFRGAIHGETMTLSIEGADHVENLKSTLKKGVRGSARPCA
jgi:phosphotransferase system HPr-like phosphotransfer protein